MTTNNIEKRDKSELLVKAFINGDYSEENILKVQNALIEQRDALMSILDSFPAHLEHHRKRNENKATHLFILIEHTKAFFKASGGHIISEA